MNFIPRKTNLDNFLSGTVLYRNREPFKNRNGVVDGMVFDERITKIFRFGDLRTETMFRKITVFRMIIKFCRLLSFVYCSSCWIGLTGVRIMECRREENLKDCTCTYQCPRRGLCCECVAHHRAKNQIPGCFFQRRGSRLGPFL